MAAHDVWENPTPPFSFEYDGRPSAGLIHNGHQEQTSQPSPGGKTTHRWYRDPATGLVVTAHIRTFDAFPAADWVLELENAGSANTPIIDHLLPLDLSWARGRTEQVTLHRAKGSECVLDDFLPVDEILRPGRPLRLAPNQGRSSDGVLPFMNLQWPGGGAVLYCDIRVDGFPTEAARQAIAELKRLRPYYLGDFYPLLPLTVETHDWCAYQYHRPAEGDGFALFLRRHESPFPTMEFALRGIDPDAEYEIGATETFAEPMWKQVRGIALAQWVAQISQQPGSLLFQYRRA